MSVLTDASDPSLTYDLYARRGRAIIQKFLDKIDRGTIQIPTLSTSEATQDPVGILGAGQSLLFYFGKLSISMANFVC